MQQPHNSILALDVGEKRIGIALASRAARIASPLATLPNDSTFKKRFAVLVEENSVDTIVVGLPRGIDGQDTNQTAYAQEFAKGLQLAPDLRVQFQDEALTSVKAEEELQARGVRYTKEDVDALSATYILEDFLQGETA
jgi:putative holliday junction resolvase